MSLLHTKGWLPYQWANAVAFFANGEFNNSFEEKGGYAPIKMSLEQYAWVFWRVSKWKFAGRFGFSVGDVYDENANIVSPAWTMEPQDFEFISQRPPNEIELMSQTNDFTNSVFQGPNQTIQLNGTAYRYNTAIAEGTQTPIGLESATANYSVTASFAPEFGQGQQEISIFSVGKSQIDPSKVAVTARFQMSISGSATFYDELSQEVSFSVDTFYRQDQNELETGIAGIGTIKYFSSIEDSNLQADFALFAPGEEPSLNFTGPVIVDPIEYYPYAVYGQPPLYDTDTGQPL